MNTLSAVSPHARAVIEADRREGARDVNPVMELYALTDWIIRTIDETPPADPSSEAVREVRAILRLLESNFEVGDQAVDDLISASFLEALQLASADVRGRIREMLPPRMAAWYALAVEPGAARDS